MILVIDVGNTNIVLGLYQERTLLHHWRVSTNRSATVDEYGMQLHSLFPTLGHSFAQVEGVIISSVVPPLNECNGKPLLTLFEKDAIHRWSWD